MQESYDLVQQRHPSVTFVSETPGGFCDQLSSLVRAAPGEVAEVVGGKEEEEEGEERFVMFAVDDMFFYRDFCLSSALRLLGTGELCMSFWRIYFALMLLLASYPTLISRVNHGYSCHSNRAC